VESSGQLRRGRGALLLQPLPVLLLGLRGAALRLPPANLEAL
jgi:hypothetical protein